MEVNLDINDKEIKNFIKNVASDRISKLFTDNDIEELVKDEVSKHIKLLGQFYFKEYIKEAVKEDLRKKLDSKLIKEVIKENIDSLKYSIAESISDEICCRLFEKEDY